MANDDREERLLASRALKPGGDHYRAYVGPPAEYDFMGATQFRLLTSLGLREDHHLLDLGCGSLRAGRLLIPYLLPGRYCGLEPNRWLIEDAIENELGRDLIAIKKPVFSHSNDFDLGEFDRKFDLVVAQSIFSHTGSDLFDLALDRVSDVLKPQAQFLFTMVSMDSPRAPRMAMASQSQGWIYPQCVVFDARSVVRRCEAHGLTAERLEWFHPRQTWFRCVLDERFTLAANGAALGDGRVLFDDRFA